jgi:DNA (cytosine-5)-methyltransferase 1
VRPLLLDLFCGAGGAAMGYWRAGWDVVGVDLEPQPHYPFEFIQQDALDVLRTGSLTIDYDPDTFDAIHASPPCQFASTVSGRARKGQRADYTNFIPQTRELLLTTGKPFVIENVPPARPWLRDPFLLCCSSFGLDVRRHRLFEANGWNPTITPSCAHHMQTPRFRSLDSRQTKLSTVIGVHGHLNYPGEFELRCKAMGIDWMKLKELNQAIPPVYTEWIGSRLLAALEEAA